MAMIGFLISLLFSAAPSPIHELFQPKRMRALRKRSRGKFAEAMRRAEIEAKAEAAVKAMASERKRKQRQKAKEKLRAAAAKEAAKGWLP